MFWLVGDDERRPSQGNRIYNADTRVTTPVILAAAGIQSPFYV